MALDLDLVIGGHTVTGDIVEITITAEELDGAQTAEIILLNESNEWGNDFAVKDAVNFDVDSTDFWDGYVEDVEPYNDHRFADLPLIKVRCLDYGFDLVKLFIDKDYGNQPIDDIVDDVLSEASSEVTFTTASSASNGEVDFKREYLARGFRQLCQDTNYVFYVDRTKALHLFAYGAATEYLDGGGGRADVDLDSVANSRSNNILEFKEGESLGSKTWNYIELNAGFLQDHYTDENYDDYTAGTSCTITNETGSLYNTYWRGRSGIRITRTTSNGTLLGSLDFSGTLYEYASLDLSENSVLHYLLYCGFDEASGTNKRLRLRLEDKVGNIIEFRKHLAFFEPAAKHDRTDNLTKGEWYKPTIPIGNAQDIADYGSGGVAGWEYTTNLLEDIDIAGAYTSANIDADNGSGKAVITASGGTPYSGLEAGERISLSNCEDEDNNGLYEIHTVTDTVITLTETLGSDNATDTAIEIDSVFNWGGVEEIFWRSPALVQTNGYIIIDDLTIPTVTAKSIAQDSTSITNHGKRMLPLHKPHIGSQKQLDVLSASLLAKHKDPLQALDLLVKGNTDIKYPGQSLDVNAPPYGIAVDTEYRIQKIQHRFTMKGGSRKDYLYTTKLNLVAVATKTSPAHFRDPYTDALIASQEYWKQREMYEEKQQNPWVDWFGKQEDAEGATFPANPYEGQVWELTATSGAYKPGVYVYKSNLTITRAGAYTSANIQSDGGAGKGTITADGGTPFSSLSAGETIWTSQCENQENNLNYVIDTVTDTVITVTSLIDTTNTDDTSIIIDRMDWQLVGLTYLADATDFATVEWPTDQMAIEVRPWSTNLSVIWDDATDEPPTDWNHIKWGAKGGEGSGGTDATIDYNDGTTLTITAGETASVGDGDWWVYWNGTSTLQWSQTYGDASGVGVGIVAQVNINDTKAPSIIMYNGYVPSAGFGSIVSHAINSKHISADWITGKNIRSASGTTNVEISSTGIIGQASGVTQFSLASATGVATFMGGDAVIDVDGIKITGDGGEIVGVYLYNNTPALSAYFGLGGGGALMIKQEIATEHLRIVHADGQFIYLESDGDIAINSAGAAGSNIVLTPAADVQVWSADIIPEGTNGKLGRTGAEAWNEVHADDIYGTVRYA